MAHKTALSGRAAAAHSNSKSGAKVLIESRLSPVAAEIVQRHLAAASAAEEAPQIEVCLSPLLWSESLGHLHDG